MKTLKLLVGTFTIGFIASIFISHVSLAQSMTKSERYPSRTFGFGPVLSTSPGIGLHAQVSREDFIKADLAYSQNEYFDISIDYAVGYPDAFDSGGAVVPYWGVGGTIIGQDDSDDLETGSVGVRIPLGINVNIARTPLMATFEATPTALFAPSTNSYLRASAALKVMF